MVILRHKVCNTRNATQLAPLAGAFQPGGIAGKTVLPVLHAGQGFAENLPSRLMDAACIILKNSRFEPVTAISSMIVPGRRGEVRIGITTNTRQGRNKTRFDYFQSPNDRCVWPAHPNIYL